MGDQAPLVNRDELDEDSCLNVLKTCCMHAQAWAIICFISSNLCVQNQI